MNPFAEIAVVAATWAVFVGLSYLLRALTAPLAAPAPVPVPVTTQPADLAGYVADGVPFETPVAFYGDGGEQEEQ